MRERKGLTLTRNAKYYSYGEVIYKRTNDIPFGCCGEYTDSESGPIYLRNRYYEPASTENGTKTAKIEEMKSQLPDAGLNFYAAYGVRTPKERTDY